MKIIGVMGSPSKNGNTSILAREVLRGAREAGAETEEIVLAEHRIEYCRGCVGKMPNMCMSTGKCNIDDDAEILKRQLYAADGLILATPSYGLGPTALMKNFIVDRIGMFTAYTSGLGGKYFVGVSTCGGFGAKKVARDIVKHFVAGFHRRGYVSGVIGVALGYNQIGDRPETLAKAYRTGAKLVRDIERKRKFPFQSLIDRIMVALIVRRIIVRNIYANRNGQMKAVYENLISRGLIKPVVRDEFR